MGSRFFRPVISLGKHHIYIAGIGFTSLTAVSSPRLSIHSSSFPRVSKSSLCSTIFGASLEWSSPSPPSPPVNPNHQKSYNSEQALHSRFLGYTKDPTTGGLVIVDKEAAVVRRIYRDFLDGAGFAEIAHSLEADFVPNGAGNMKWHPTNVKQILRNEKYVGDALLQKTVTTDFLSKRRIINDGSVQQYYVEGDHPAIIPRPVFEAVQEEIAQRAGQRGMKHYLTGRVHLYRMRRKTDSAHLVRSVPAHCLEMQRPGRWKRVQVQDGSGGRDP